MNTYTGNIRIRLSGIKPYDGENGKGSSLTMQLFDLENDLQELHDVAAEHPDIVGKMNKWMIESGTVPENPKFRF